MPTAKQTRRKLRWAVNYAVAIGWLLGAGAISVQAFTLIPAPSLVVGPTSGTPTATFAVQGSMGPGLPCTRPANFAFYWDATVNLLAYKTVATCTTPTSGTYDTGTIGGLRPAAGYDTVGPHTVILTVTDSTGAPYGPVSTVTKSYTITAPPPPPPPPSPSPQAPPPPPPSPSVAPASPSTQPAASPSASASPTQGQCPAAGAALPSGPGGKDGAMVLGLVLIGALPIGGIVMVFSPGLWSGRSRWRKIASLLGLTVVLMGAATCSFPSCAAPAATSQTASPPASPTPTC